MRCIATATHTILLSTRDAFARHFDLFHVGRKPVGLYLRVPFTSLSLWLEWREHPVGFGHDHASATDWEFFAGHIQGVVSLDPVMAR